MFFQLFGGLRGLLWVFEGPLWPKLLPMAHHFTIVFSGKTKSENISNLDDFAQKQRENWSISGLNLK